MASQASGPCSIRTVHCPQCSQSLHAWKYLLLALGIVDLREKTVLRESKSQGHWGSALLFLRPFPTSLSRQLCIHLFIVLAMILSPAHYPSHVQLQLQCPIRYLPRLGQAGGMGDQPYLERPEAFLDAPVTRTSVSWAQGFVSVWFTAVSLPPRTVPCIHSRCPINTCWIK